MWVKLRLCLLPGFPVRCTSTTWGFRHDRRISGTGSVVSAPLQASQTSVIQWQRAMETGLRIASSQPVVLLQLTRRAVCSFLMAGVAQNNTFNVAISIRCGLLCKDTAPRGMGLYSYRLIDSLPISALSGIRVKVVSFAIPFQTINKSATLLSASKLALLPLQACILD